MQEPQRKGIKDLFKKIVKGASDAEKTIHGNLGRDVADAADRLGKKLPKFLSPEEYDQSDMDKAMDIWKKQGMGKIGNQPKGDKYMTKPKDNYVTKPNDGEYVNDPYTAMKYSAFAKKLKDTNKDNLVMRREPPSKGEIAAGRAITTGGILGTGAAKAHSYWTDKKNEKK
jgi:hypothetical protein